MIDDLEHLKEQVESQKDRPGTGLNVPNGMGSTLTLNTIGASGDFKNQWGSDNFWLLNYRQYWMFAISCRI